ncbi:efflux RND transporter permease subunit [Pirellulaceae bacterium SH449]
MGPSNPNKKTFYDRFAWLILIPALLWVPFAFMGAGNAIQSNVNKVEDWLPKNYSETGELSWFRKNFPSDQFIIISWDGCTLTEDPEGDPSGDDPRIARLAELIYSSDPAPEDPDSLEARQYFKGVTTGRTLVNQLTSGQYPLAYADAIQRLKGSVIGPDGRQTCVVVSLDPTTTAKLKPVLGHEQKRIFRPNVPPGVLRRLIEKAGIEDPDLHMGGPPVDNISIDEEGERTLVRLAGFSGLLGIGLAWWSLRSLLLTGIVFFCAVVNAATALSIIHYTGQTVDAIVLTMPSLVYVLSISGAVHLINYYRDAVREGGLYGATERGVIHALRPATLCGVTTALGLASLYASELVPIRKFGVYSAAGVICLNIVLFLLLPSILHILKYARRWEGEYLGAKPKGRKASEAIEVDTKAEKLWGVFARFIVRHNAAVAISFLVIAGTITFGVTKVRTSIDLLELFDSQARILKDYRWLEDRLGMLVPLEIVVEFDKDSMAKSADVAESDARALEASRGNETIPEELDIEELTKLSFIERMETVIRVQEVISQEFGEAGPGIVGRSISAATFASNLPPKGSSTQTYFVRKALNKILESKKDEFIQSGFLRIDPDTGNELWRISLRVAAFQGVDYGQFVTELKDAVSPIILAQEDRVRILRQIVAWSGDAKLTRKDIRLWSPAGRNMSPEEQRKAKVRTEELVSLLAKARIKVTRLDAIPTDIALVELQKLADADAVVLSGGFTNADVGAIQGGNLRNVIDLHAHDENAPDRWINSVYTGVVPIVYKAQRALLISLVESTVWAFLTISPLMFFVCRGIKPGMIAMIPNVVPVGVIFGAMGWLGTAVDIGSMMTASIALGVAVDDTIHYLAWFRRDLDEGMDVKTAIVHAYKKCATPALQAACISGIGLSVFSLSTFTPTQRFGWLMLMILIAGVVAELVLLPAILAGPLGKVFDVKSGKHSKIGRLFLIFRYEIRKRFDRTGKSSERSDSEFQSAA